MAFDHFYTNILVFGREGEKFFENSFHANQVFLLVSWEKQVSKPEEMAKSPFLALPQLFIWQQKEQNGFLVKDMSDWKFVSISKQTNVRRRILILLTLFTSK